jgi:predicted component of type VI protein secretion system
MGYLIIVWIGFSFLVGFLANERGRSWVGWTLLSIVTSPLFGAICVLIAADLKAQAETREREERRHREQLAALAGTKAAGVSERASDDPQWLRSSPAVETSQRSVADEIEKLASLRNRGLLTAEEFAEQRARLLA